MSDNYLRFQSLDLCKPSEFDIVLIKVKNSNSIPEDNYSIPEDNYWICTTYCNDKFMYFEDFSGVRFQESQVVGWMHLLDLEFVPVLTKAAQDAMLIDDTINNHFALDPNGQVEIYYKGYEQGNE